MKGATLTMEAIKHPITTEKAVRLMQTENKLTFIVDRKATKEEVKKALEELLNVKIEKINSLITHSGHKKVYAKLSKENPAIDVATKLGFM